MGHALEVGRVGGAELCGGIGGGGGGGREVASVARGPFYLF